LYLPNTHTLTRKPGPKKPYEELFPVYYHEDMWYKIHMNA
jgi:hypothetical protein